MWSGDLGRAMKTDVIPSLKKRMQQKLFENTCFNLCKRNLLPGRTVHIKVSTRSITLAITKMNKNDNFDFFPVAPIQVAFSFSLRSISKLTTCTEYFPWNLWLVIPSHNKATECFDFWGKKNWQTEADEATKFSLFFRYLKTVNFTIAPPINNF